MFAALAVAERTTLEARNGSRVVWQVEHLGTGGPLTVAGPLVIAALGGAGEVAGLALRGSPGAALVAVDRATGQSRWTLAVDANEWAIVTSIAAIDPTDLVVAGSFSGTLRIGDQVVSSGGRHDGFVARIAATGAPRWLRRVGGPGGDSVQGVATRGTRIAITGTFSAGADLLGESLLPFDERSVMADLFVAELDADGARKWTHTFGGKADDAAVGIAIDSRGRIAIAANARDTIRHEGKDLVTRGPSDGLVAWYGLDGAPGAAFLIGDLDADGLHAITAVDDRIVIGGFFAGTVNLGGAQLRAHGDDAFVAVLDGREVVDVVHIAGAGREELVALAAVPGGFAAGIAHTAGFSIAGATPPAPRDPARGAAIVVQPVP
ncbi:MAG: hypothetical protein WKG01_24335 [Kofleriaceae bacterium]